MPAVDCCARLCTESNLLLISRLSGSTPRRVTTRNARKCRVLPVMSAARFIPFTGMARSLILPCGLARSLSDGLRLRMWLGISINRAMGRVIVSVMTSTGERLAKRSPRGRHQEPFRTLAIRSRIFLSSNGFPVLCPRSQLPDPGRRLLLVVFIAQF